MLRFRAMWFKARYVNQILSGEKTSTIRTAWSMRKRKVGDVVPASVGPVYPFAYLRIDAVESVVMTHLPEDVQQDVVQSLGAGAWDTELVRVRFTLLNETGHPPLAHNRSASDRSIAGPT